MYKDFYEKYKNDIKNCFTDLKSKDKRIKQIPNLLTASRLLAPFFIVPAAFSGNLPLAILFTCLFELTDMVDGIAARKLNAVSEFGKDLDPIVDKLFAAGLAIPLIFTNPVIIINIISEILITKFNTESKRKGNVPRTTILGKLKTASLSISFLFAYLNIASNIFAPWLVNVVLAQTAILELLTAKQYKEIDKEKDNIKKVESNNKKEINNNEIDKNKTKEIIKKYSRLNEVNDLKKLKDELLSNKTKNKEKIKQLKK